MSQGTGKNRHLLSLVTVVVMIVANAVYGLYFTLLFFHDRFDLTEFVLYSAVYVIMPWWAVITLTLVSIEFFRSPSRQRQCTRVGLRSFLGISMLTGVASFVYDIWAISSGWTILVPYFSLAMTLPAVVNAAVAFRLLRWFPPC